MNYNTDLNESGFTPRDMWEEKDFKIFIYLAASVLSCGTPDLWSLLRPVGYLVAAGKLLVVACGI